VISITDRALLRLHVEAVWQISLPPLDRASVVFSKSPKLPPWALYLAHLKGDQVIIWRPDVGQVERSDLIARAASADDVFDPVIGMRREVVLRHVGAQKSPLPTPMPEARLLTAADVASIEAFEAGTAEYFLDQSHASCFGIFAGGQLASVAHSSRRTASACELGINTLPDARRQGYAAVATRAWTEAIEREGLIPIYSAFAHNVASLRLAAACGYERVSESVYGPISDARE
jgi:RimJ/RimL family protein N-acetyltransferase